MKVDSNKLPLTRFINSGRFKVKGFVVYGNGAPTVSWDSRYFGELPSSSLLTYAKPVFFI
jgi:type IV secretory pathway protease TraF